VGVGSCTLWREKVEGGGGGGEKQTKSIVRATLALD
jgi:hypothetical protein